MQGSKIFFKKIPSINFLNISKSISKNPILKIIGIRPGDKLHETMISVEYSLYTLEYKNSFKIIPNINNNPKFYKNQKSKYVKTNFSYSSDSNTRWKDQKFLYKYMAKLQNM